MVAKNDNSIESQNLYSKKSKAWIAFGMSDAYILTCLALIAGGCLQEDYKDPEAFVEKYIRADFERECPRSLWKEFQYADVVFENATSKMIQSASGPVNEVVCDVRIVPERRTCHYEPVDLNWGFSYGLGILHRGTESFLKPERVKRLNNAIENLHKKRPLLVRRMSLEPDPEISVTKDTVSCFRTRDENGIFVPLEMGEKVFNYQGVFWRFQKGRVFGEKMLKAYGGVEFRTPEGQNAYVTFSNRCISVQTLISDVNAIAEEIRGVTNNVRWGRASYVRTRYTEMFNAEVEPLKAALSKVEADFGRRSSLCNRKLRDLKGWTGKLEDEKQRLKEAQANRVKTRADMIAKIEHWKVIEEREKQPIRGARIIRGRSVQWEINNLKAKIEKLDKTQKESEERLLEIAAQLEKNRAEQERLTAEFAAEKVNTTAKIGELKKRIEVRTAEIKEQALTDGRKKLDELEQKFKARIDALTKLL